MFISFSLISENNFLNFPPFLFFISPPAGDAGSLSVAAGEDGGGARSAAGQTDRRPLHAAGAGLR